MTRQPHPNGSTPPEDAASTGDVAREQGEQVKDEVTQQAQGVAATVTDETSHVAHEAAGHARDLATNAKEQLHRQAREQTAHLGGALGELGDRVHALADGRPEDAGAVGDYTERIADRVDGLAARVSNAGFDDIVADVQSFARRRPGAFLASAAVAGFTVSRLGRGVQASKQEQDGSGTSADGAPSASRAAPTAAPAPTSPPPLPAGQPTGVTSPTDGPPPVDPIAPARDPAVRAESWSSEQVRR